MALARRRLIDIGLLVLVNLMWAGQYPAYKIATAKMGPVTVSAWTFLVAGIILLPFLFWQNRSDSERKKVGPHKPSPDRHFWTHQNLVSFTMVGILGLVPASAFLAWGIERSTASNAALLYLTVPIITAVLAAIILHERMTKVRWAGLSISLIGVLVLSGFDLRHMQLGNARYFFGNILVLLACTSSSFYNVYSKELLRRLSPLEVLVCGYYLAVLVSLPLLIWVEPFSLSSLRNYSVSTWLALLVLSVLSWGLAMVLWMFLLTRLDVSQASISIYLLPLLGALISVATLKEAVTPALLLGGFVTLAGTFCAMVADGSST